MEEEDIMDDVGNEEIIEDVGNGSRCCFCCCWGARSGSNSIATSDFCFCAGCGCVELLKGANGLLDAGVACVGWGLGVLKGLYALENVPPTPAIGSAPAFEPNGFGRSPTDEGEGERRKGLEASIVGNEADWPRGDVGERDVADAAAAGGRSVPRSSKGLECLEGETTVMVE
ncbi:hypothetical protein HK101_004728, partial [Irineochytrium annulatum]